MRGVTRRISLFEWVVFMMVLMVHTKSGCGIGLLGMR